MNVSVIYEYIFVKKRCQTLIHYDQGIGQELSNQVKMTKIRKNGCKKPYTCSSTITVVQKRTL